MNRNSLSTYDSAMLSDDGDLYSDDEDGNSYGSGELRNSLGEKIIPSAADRRAHHNALERKRRDHIKDSFSSLRDSVPSLQGEKVTASRAQILKKAAEYIQFMRKKNTNVQQDIDDIAKQNKMLEDQIRKMEKIRPGSSGMTKQQLSSLFSSNEPTDVSTSYDISENSNGSSNSGLGSRPMVVSAVAGTSATTNSIAAVSIMNSIDNSNNKNNNGTVLNGSVAGTVAVRPVTMKNGTSKIIVQNPQHKNTPHVIHVTTTPGGTSTGNGLASNISMSGTGTPIIISTSQLSSPSSSVSMGSSNGTNNGYVINKGAGAISLASVQNGFRTLVVQSGVGSGTPSAVTATPNIHILGTIPANSYSKPPTKKIKISSDSDSIISPVGGGNNGTNNVTSVSS